MPGGAVVEPWCTCAEPGRGMEQERGEPNESSIN